MRNAFVQIEMPAIVSLVFLVLTWSYGRAIRRSRPFTPFMRGLTLYSFLFMLGILYFIVWTSEIGAVLGIQANRAWIAPSAAWAAILVWVAWWRYRAKHTASPLPRKSIWALAQEVLPTVGLLVCLIGLTIEGDFVVKGQGRILLALPWAAGVVAFVLLARRNRRAAVVTALRAFLGLLVIGALAEGSLLALAAVAVTGAVLFLLEKLWRKGPPLQGLGRLQL